MNWVMYMAQINVCFFLITLIVKVYIIKETKLWIFNIFTFYFLGKYKPDTWFGSLNVKYIDLLSIQ